MLNNLEARLTKELAAAIDELERRAASADKLQNDNTKISGELLFLGSLIADICECCQKKNRPTLLQNVYKTVKEKSALDRKDTFVATFCTVPKEKLDEWEVFLEILRKKMKGVKAK